MKLCVALATAAVLVGGCGQHPQRAVPPSPPAKVDEAPPIKVAPSEEPSPTPATSSDDKPLPPRVVLVTIDGVRWQDVFESGEKLMPRAWELVARSGVALGHGARCGAVRTRNTTHISLPGYLEIFTGHRTTCMSNLCPTVSIPTVLDAAAAAGLSVASISSWEVLRAAASWGKGNVFLSAGIRWPGARPLEDAKLEAVVTEGEKAKPFPAIGGTYRPDRHTGAIALEYLRARRPHLLHIGLGDSDEYGHRSDRGGYIAALRAADTFIGELADALDKAGLAKSTAVIVVADHGRARSFRDHGPRYPESGRSWVLAFGGAVPKRGEVCARREIWLTDIAPTIRVLLGLPRDTSRSAIGKLIEEIAQR